MVIKNQEGHGSADHYSQGKTGSGTAHDENAAKVRDSRESDAAISWVGESNARPHREPQERANKGKRHQSCEVTYREPSGVPEHVDQVANHIDVEAIYLLLGGYEKQIHAERQRARLRAARA